MSEVTQILSSIQQGDPKAADELLPLVYAELRRLAKAKFANEKPGLTLQATELVHEAFIRLVGQETDWDSRRHFFSAAAEAMRRILIERARSRKTQKRGGNFERMDVDPGQLVADERDDELLEVNEALSRLAEVDVTKAELVKLRYFAGMTIPEAAQALGIGVSTAEKYWTYAKCWLRAEISGLPGDDPRNSA